MEQLLQDELATCIARPGESAYTECLASYWSDQEKEAQPQCIVSPESAADVAKTLSILHKANVESDFAVPFAVRAGGHTPWAGSANCHGGITINLRKLNKVTLSEDGETVTVGGGAYWQEVYDVVHEKNRLVAGARTSQCGVAGLTLGGGISYYSPKTGFVCDNVLAFDVALASGDIIRADPKQHSDLFRALKGGSNNFGIVVAFVFKTLPLTEIWGGFQISEFEQISAYMKAFTDMVAKEDYDSNALALITAIYAPQFGGKLSYAGLKYTAAVKEPAVFSPFSAIPSRNNTMRMAPLKEYVDQEYLSFAEQKLRRLFMSTAFFNDLDMLQAAVKIWEKHTEKLKQVSGLLNWSLVVNPILPCTIQCGIDAGGNVLGFEPGRPVLIASLSSGWQQGKDDEFVVQACRDLLAEIANEAKAKGVFHPYIYMNYGWEGQEVIDGYGQENKQFMQQVSKRYDPQQLFQKAVPGGFKLK